MKVQRSHLRIAVVVLLLAVAYNAWVFLKPAARTTPQANRQPVPADVSPAARSGAAVGIDPVSIPAPPPVEVGAEPSGGRDPFLFGDERRDGWVRPAQETRAVDPLIRTILFSATRKTALIDNRMVSVGDSVGTLKVAEIERDAVVFVSAGGERRRVPLHRGSASGIRR